MTRTSINSDILTDNDNCKICIKVFKTNQNCIYCDICKMWLHLKCANLSLHQFNSLSNTDLPFYCVTCLSTVLPFVNMNKTDFKHSFSSGYKSQAKCKY